MKSSEELMQEEAVTEKQLAVHTMLDIIKWLYASGLALNGAALLKLADIEVLGTAHLVAGGFFLAGLFSCFIAAAMLGQVASQALEEADNKLKLLFSIREGKAKAEDLVTSEAEMLEKGEPRIRVMGSVLAASLGCFILALLALGLGQMADRLERSVGQAVQRTEQTVKTIEPRKVPPSQPTSPAPPSKP